MSMGDSQYLYTLLVQAKPFMALLVRNRFDLFLLLISVTDILLFCYT